MPTPKLSFRSKVLYIMGCPHSGSTILSIIFNNNTNTENVGELLTHINFIPKWMLETSRNICTCGQGFRECDFWSTITDRTIKKIGGSEAWDRFIAISKEYNSSTKILGSLLSRPFDGSQKQIYLNNVKQLYDTISEVSDSDLIVDSSKSIDHALFLKLNFSNIYLIHLVRNGEDFVASLLHRLDEDRPRAFRSDVFKKSFMKPVYVLLISIWWFIQNLTCELIRITGKKQVIKIRYEDLCEDPERELRKISEFVGKDFSDMIDKVIHQQEALRVGHLICGNSMRFDKNIVFKPVSRKKELPFLYKAIHRLAAFPLIIYYGYWK